MNPAANQLQLRDIHLPDGVSWWLPAPGWWLLLIVMLLVIVLGVFLYRYRQQRRLHRAARQELERISMAYAQNADTQQLVREVSIWLRRVCLSFYPRSEVAGLTGADWLAFLDQPLIASKQAHRFSEGAARILDSAPYQASTDIEADAVLLVCQSWLQSLPRRRRTTA